MPFTNRNAQKVIQKTFLLENSSTTINGEKAAVTDIRGDSITVEFEAPPKLSQNDRVRIYVPKKVIGITDFEVIRGHEKAIGLISMESLTTAMVNSGQFIVVERNKPRRRALRGLIDRIGNFSLRLGRLCLYEHDCVSERQQSRPLIHWSNLAPKTSMVPGCP